MPEVPLQSDLNSESTVSEIMSMAVQYRQEMINEFSKMDDDELRMYAGEVTVASDLGIHMAGDGSPSYQCGRINDRDPKKWKHVNNMNGSMHKCTRCLL